MLNASRLATFVSLLFTLAALVPPIASAQVEPTTAGAQPDGPAWQTFDEAMHDARESGKRVLVDVYAPWCGYCRKMQKETYTDDAVKAHMNEYFEFARLDGTDQESTLMYAGEEMTPAALARRFGTTGYPTTVFLQPDGEVIAGQPGFIDAGTFTTMIEYVGSGAIEEQSYQEFVESVH